MSKLQNVNNTMTSDIHSKTTREITSRQLSANSGAQSLMAFSMAWMDSLYDHDRHMLRHPDQPKQHMVRESLWYALGLVFESLQTGERDARIKRVVEIVSNVLACQYNTPGKIWHGTFKRAPQESDPPDGAVIWKDYDPNWRQFVGTILLLLRRLEGHLVLTRLVPAIDAALIRCIEGEPVNRVPPGYTNIALMKAWLEIEAGDLVDASIQARGLSYAHKIREAFCKHNAFAEYNSPTYYGINFFALGLWQNFSDDLEEMGREINTRLWADVARFYHAGMKNLCGPWSRSYGMDMQHYVSALSLWIWAVTEKSAAPFPQSTRDLVHGHDFCLGPIAAFSAVASDPDIKERLTSFEQAQIISQQISSDPLRKAEAYLSPNLMIGLESSSRSFHGTDQYHPLTIHWLKSDNAVGWCRLRFKGSTVGSLNQNILELKFTADPHVTSASLQFSDCIRLDALSVSSDGLTMTLETGCQLEADGNNLTITFPNSLRENAVSIICKVDDQGLARP